LADIECLISIRLGAHRKRRNDSIAFDHQSQVLRGGMTFAIATLAANISNTPAEIYVVDNSLGFTLSPGITTCLGLSVGLVDQRDDVGGTRAVEHTMLAGAIVIVPGMRHQVLETMPMLAARGIA